jgi:hypothetical protein
MADLPSRSRTRFFDVNALFSVPKGLRPGRQGLPVLPLRKK